MYQKRKVHENCGSRILELFGFVISMVKKGKLRKNISVLKHAQCFLAIFSCHNTQTKSLK